MASVIGSAPAVAATFVYVSNAGDGDIGVYRMLDSGDLQPSARIKAARTVGPMAVSPDRRFLYAAARSKPYTVYVYSIDGGTGALTPLSTSPLAESFPYLSLDKTGRYLFGVSYGGHVISVNAVASDGRVASEPLQVIPVGRNAHSIRVDASNKFVYVPSLGSDAIFLFNFDAETGKLTYRSSTPTERQPRGFNIDPKGRFLVATGEKSETISVYAIDQTNGAPELLNKYPTGKGSNWVEIVSFD